MTPGEMAKLDQATQSFLDTVPALLWGFYARMKECGFDEVQSFQLTRDYMCVLAKGNAGN